MHTTLKSCQSKLCNITLLLTKTHGLRCKQFICLHCYYERSKVSPFTLTQTVRWWRHCCTALAWWYGLPSPHQ